MARPTNFEKNKGVNDLALKAGTSVTTVSRKLRQGKTAQQILEEAQEWNSKHDASLESDGANESHSAAQTRKEIAIASLRELELATKSGELVPLVEINSWVAGMIIRARQVLTRIAPELADRLANESNPIRIRELLDGEINRALNQMSQYTPKG